MRRLRMLPVSIAAHVAAVLALLIIPLAAEVGLPAPAPLAGPEYMAVKPVPVPAAPAPSRSNARPAQSSNAAPVAAGSSILPEPPLQPPSAPPGVSVAEGGLGSFGDIVGGVGTVITVPEPPPPAPAPPAVKLVRSGGEVREPRKIVDVVPVYPPLAQAGRIEGIVILEAVISERGTVERIKVLRSVPLLDAAAIDAVKRWRYTPTLLNGVPVQVLMTITIRFTLQN